MFRMKQNLTMRLGKLIILNARDECLAAPVSYTPNEFVTNALQHSNVKLTWDDEDTERIKVTRRKFSKQDLKEMDFTAYLASDSEESVDYSKYSSLLEKEEESEKEDMEITFISGLSDKASQLLEKKKQSDLIKNETVFESNLRKQREKKKAKKLAKRAESDPLVDENESEHDSDPFFKFDDSEYKLNEKEDKKTMSKAEVRKAARLLEKEEAKSNAQLELLLMDDQDSQHFDQKSILKKQKHSKKKKAVLEDTQDQFEMNFADPRFSQVFSSHHYAIDPTNSQFKKTENMKALLSERRKRRKNEEN
jgi:hypothetical protein